MMAKPWAMSHLRSELPLLVDGVRVDVAHVMKVRAGANFTLQCGKHFITFCSSDEFDASRVTATINGGTDFEFRSSLQVYVTPSAVVFQQDTKIPWPEPMEPRRGPPQLGAWAKADFGAVLLSPLSVARPAIEAFARRIRLVGVLFCSSENELSANFERRLEQCYVRGLQLDMGIVVATIESSAEVAASVREGMHAEWAILPYEETGRVCRKHELKGVPRLVVLDAYTGAIVRTNAVLDVMTHCDEPATVIKLCGVPDPTCWTREQARRRAASYRLRHKVELKPEELVHAFRSADVDNSGSVSLGELLGAFRTLGLQVTEVTLRVFRELDDNHSNALDFVEFCRFCSLSRDLLQPRDPERRRLLAIFAANDVDGIGFVTMDVLVTCLAQAGAPTNVGAVCALTNRSAGDGSEIDFPEFVQVFQRLQAATTTIESNSQVVPGQQV